METDEEGDVDTEDEDGKKVEDGKKESINRMAGGAGLKMRRETLISMFVRFGLLRYEMCNTFNQMQDIAEGDDLRRIGAQVRMQLNGDVKGRMAACFERLCRVDE